MVLSYEPAKHAGIHGDKRHSVNIKAFIINIAGIFTMLMLLTGESRY